MRCNALGADPRDWIARRRLRGLRLRGACLPTPGDVVGYLTAMQAQEHTYARWSVAQRTAGSPSATVVDAAFAEGRILRTHVLRPTWHYVAPKDLWCLVRLSGPMVDAANRPRYRDLGLNAQTLNRSNDIIAHAVAGPVRTRRELAAVLEEHGISSANQRLAHMLMHAELTAIVCNGPMRGTQHTYAAFDERVPPDQGLEGDEALAELAWRYFSTRGPATLNDFSWWSGINASDARRGLRAVQSRLSQLDIDGGTYWFTDESAPRLKQRVDLIQCYDELIISYRQTRDVLRTQSATFPVPRHLDGFQHVVLLGGRLLGHWRVRADPAGTRIETRVSRQLDDSEQIALNSAIDRYRRFIEPLSQSVVFMSLR